MSRDLELRDIFLWLYYHAREKAGKPITYEGMTRKIGLTKGRLAQIFSKLDRQWRSEGTSTNMTLQSYQVVELMAQHAQTLANDNRTSADERFIEFCSYLDGTEEWPEESREGPSKEKSPEIHQIEPEAVEAAHTAPVEAASAAQSTGTETPTRILEPVIDR